PPARRSAQDARARELDRARGRGRRPRLRPRKTDAVLAAHLRAGLGDLRAPAERRRLERLRARPLFDLQGVQRRRLRALVREDAGGRGERLKFQTVIVGGGAIGCSIAYHLGKLGQRDVAVVEKAQLTHGSTWHAAGLVGQLRSKRNLTRLMQNSVALYRTLERETG